MTRERFGEVRLHLDSMTDKEMLDAAGYAWADLQESERRFNVFMSQLVLRGIIPEYPVSE